VKLLVIISTHFSVAWRGLSVCLSVCRLSHSCIVLEPFDGFRWHLADLCTCEV